MVTTLTPNEHLSTDNLDLLLVVLPPPFAKPWLAAPILNRSSKSCSIWADNPKRAIRDEAVYLNDSLVSHEDLQYVASRVGTVHPRQPGRDRADASPNLSDAQPTR